MKSRNIIFNILLLIVIVVTLSLSVNADITSNLHTYISFDDSTISGSDYLDVSGNAHECTISGDTTTGLDGVRNESAYFDGDNDYCLFDNGDFDSLIGSPVTVSCWVNLTNTGTDQQFLDLQGDVKVSMTHHSTLGWGVYLDSGNIFYQNTSQLNKWVMVTGTTGGLGGYRRLYINGVEKINASAINLRSEGQASSRIGTNFAGNSDTTGMIDECRIYTRALSTTEISELYNATKPLITGIPTLTLSSDIINNTYTNNNYTDYELTGVYSDTSSLFNCSFYIDDTLNNTDELNFNNSYNYRLDFNDYEGIKKIRINCSNIDISDDTNTYIINIDNIIPKINTELINSSEIMQYEYNQFNTTFNDTNLFNYSIKLYNINDELKTSVYAENVSSFAYNYTNYYLETLGEYYYIITAYDTYNNSNTIYRYYEVISESAYNTELIEDLLENNITIKDVIIMIPYIILLIVSLVIFVFSNDIRLDFLNTIIQIVMLLYFFTNNYDEIGYIVIAMIILQFIKIYQTKHQD